MNKDYLPSKKYTCGEIERLQIPYVLQDSCTDLYVPYITCKKENMPLFENLFLYRIPLLNKISSCSGMYEKWQKCQDKREREIFEKMRQIYRDSFKDYV